MTLFNDLIDSRIIYILIINYIIVNKEQFFLRIGCYLLIVQECPILIIASASADASGDKSAAKKSKISAILGLSLVVPLQKLAGE